MESKSGRFDEKFLSLAATRLSFTGGTIQERRLIPAEGYSLEENPDTPGSVMLRRRAGGAGGGISVSCTCGLEGGGCVPVIINPGSPDEYAVCLPDTGCGSSGLFCFMDFDFGGGLRLRFKM